ncbi:MAG: hypothetical protein JSR64_05925 [Nitrospira sp.]|nr:hypothetical protein [Nitrospira sp.]
MPAGLKNPVLDLRNSLRGALHDSFVAPVWGAPEVMHQALKEVKKRFDSAEASVSEKSIAASVWAFRRTGKLDSFRDLKYTCYGLTLRQGKDESTLLGDEKLYPALIDEVHGVTKEPRKFRKCYQGLLNSYLNFPADDSSTDVEKRNWEHLQNYLRRQLRLILTVEPIASWIHVLKAHENLLKPNPCKRYAEGLREGKWDELEELARGLAISSASWVWKEAVLAHVQAVAEIRADIAFRQELDLALHALEGQRVPLGDELRKTGTASLLRRYARCSDHPQHEALLDQALHCFGKPWLNRTAWDAYVGDEDALRLIDGWTKTGLIQDFFQLLADDGVADLSRMRFWPQFVPVISDIWFAMGSYAHDSRDPKYLKLRQRIGRERVLKFASPTPTNNAFIMRMGPFYLIEFGQKGRAAYLVHADRWKEPLTPGATVQLAVHRLQSMGGEQMRHYPLPWEKTFCNVICPRIGWWPGSPPPKPTTQITESLAGRPTESKKKSPSTQRGTASGTAHDTEEDPFFTALMSRLADNGLQIDDLRRKGGCLWVRADTKDQSLNRILLGAGFTYSGGNGWWKK